MNTLQGSELEISQEKSKRMLDIGDYPIAFIIDDKEKFLEISNQCESLVSENYLTDTHWKRRITRALKMTLKKDHTIHKVLMNEKK